MDPLTAESQDAKWPPTQVCLPLGIFASIKVLIYELFHWLLKLIGRYFIITISLNLNQYVIQYDCAVIRTSSLWLAYYPLNIPQQSLNSLSLFVSFPRPEEVLRTGTSGKGSVSGTGSAVTVSPSGGHTIC